MFDFITSPATLVLGASGLAGTIVAHAVLSPRSRLFGPVVYRGDTSAPARVALTFDDGPDPRTTPRLLDVLAERNIHATFFVIGAKVRQASDLMRRIDEAGHLIGNHSYHHHYHGMFRQRIYWRRELERTDEAIRAAVGKSPILFRPPMGMRNPLLAAELHRGGYRVVTWTRNARDGVRPSESQVVRLGAKARAGDILLMHDGCDRPTRHTKEVTVKAVDGLLRALDDRGIDVVCLGDLIGGPYYR